MFKGCDVFLDKLNVDKSSMMLWCHRNRGGWLVNNVWFVLTDADKSPVLSVSSVDMLSLYLQ